METPNNALNKQKVVEETGNPQALQVVPGAPLASVGGTTVLGFSKPMDPFTETSWDDTSSNTYLSKFYTGADGGVRMASLDARGRMVPPALGPVIQERQGQPLQP
ncbi:UNVERIFIED_CONTAM: hypothetical protein Sindi_0749600 [Sesamum indicum]